MEGTAWRAEGFGEWRGPGDSKDRALLHEHPVVKATGHPAFAPQGLQLVLELGEEREGGLWAEEGYPGARKGFTTLAQHPVLGNSCHGSTPT